MFGRWYAKKVGDSYFGTSGVPYCAMFTSYCLDWAGVSAAGIPGAYVPWILSANADAGRLVRNEDAEPGDLVMFDWQGDGVADHIGIVEEHNVQPAGAKLSLRGDYRAACLLPCETPLVTEHENGYTTVTLPEFEAFAMVRFDR